MVRSAAGDDRRLFQRAQARRGLACVEDARLVLAHRLDEAPRERGDAGKSLQEIQRDALRGEDRACGAGDFEHLIPLDQPRAGGVARSSP